MRVSDTRELVEAHWTTWRLPIVQAAIYALVEPEDRLRIEETYLRFTRAPLLFASEQKAFLATFSLHAWQREALERIFATEALLLADDMGLGKTRVAALAGYEHHVRTGCPTLIVAPAFAREVWREEIRKLGIERKGFCALATRDMHSSSYRPDASWYFVHYDIAHAWRSHFAVMRHTQRPGTTVLDEAHWIKEGQAQRSKGAVALSMLAERRVLLTGTPIENRPSELWNLLFALCGKYAFGTAGEFRKRYAGAYQDNYGLRDTEPTNVDELRARIAPIYMRRTIDDIDPSLLPPLTRQRHSMSLTETDREKHDSIVRSVPLEELVRAVLEGRGGTETIKLLDRLRKITSAAKLQTTISLVASILESQQSAVVFCWQRATANKLASYFARTGSTRAHHDYAWTSYVVEGGIPQHGRDANVAAFMSATKPAVLVATYGTLREGVTLTRATHVVLHDLGPKPSEILQAEKRIHRLSQDKPCFSHWVVAERSIDTIFARLLTMKAEFIEATLGIHAPQQAMDAVSMAELRQDFDPVEWARAALSRQ